MKKLLEFLIEKLKEVKTDTEVEPDVKTEPDIKPKPKSPIAPEPGISPKPKAESDVALFFLQRAEGLGEKTRFPNWTSEDKQKWIKKGDEIINKLFPKLSSEEKSYLELVTSDEYNRMLSRLEQYTGKRASELKLPGFVSIAMQALNDILEIEHSYKKRLEGLAVEVVLNLPEFEMVKDAVEGEELRIEARLDTPTLADFRLEKRSENLTPEEEFNKLLASAFREELSIKRRFANLLITGGAVNKFYLFNVVKDELDKIDPTLINKYGIVAVLAELGYWVTPFGIEKIGLKGGARAGVEKVKPEGDAYTIEAKAIIFPYLIHEIVKGIYEWLSLAKEFQAIMGKEEIEDETRDMLAGPGVYRKIVGMIPADKQNMIPLIWRKLLTRSSEEIRNVLAGDDTLIKQLTREAEDEWQAYKKEREVVKEEVIEEGEVSARKKYVETGKVPEDIFSKLLEIDPTSQKKYIEWMCKIYSQEKPEISEFERVIPKFDKLVNKGVMPVDARNIQSYKSLKEVGQKVEEFDALTKSELEKEAKIKGAEKVFENDKAFVYRITTWEASCLYGKGTKWCISGESDSHHFYDYFMKYAIYFVIRKQPKRDNYDKIAILVDKSGKKMYWDAKDTQIDGNKAVEILAELGIKL